LVEITAQSVKELRVLTDAGVMDCRRALEEATGDIEKARGILSRNGVVAAAKRQSREVNQGIVEAYIHSGNRIGVLLELNCETDFVARTEDFKDLAHNLAMQIAAMAPEYVSVEEFSSGETRDASEVCLLSQSYVKEPDRTIQDLVDEVRTKTGENVRVRRFTRFALGQD
jgi:elongation factor Ts